MAKEVILVPVFGMVLLTVIVWVRMFIVRIRAMKEAGIHPEKMKSQQAKSLMPQYANVASENFVNIFEVPTLFYVLVCLLWVTDSVNAIFIAGASAYVAFRYVHSLVALTYNRVMHRFSAYVASCLILWAMWFIFGYRVLIGV